MNPSTSALLDVMPLSHIYRQLTGIEPHRVGTDRYRAKAVWRNGDGYSVSLDDSKALWYDFVTGEGGRTLDLIVRLRGGSKRDALRWLSDFTGIGLHDRKFTQREREEYAERRRRIQKTLPIARSWQRVATPLTEELLWELKARLNNRPATLTPAMGEISSVERFNARVRQAAEQASGDSLIAEYEDFLRRDPFLTGAMVQVSHIHERADEEWLRAFLEDDGARRRDAA